MSEAPSLSEVLSSEADSKIIDAPIESAEVVEDTVEETGDIVAQDVTEAAPPAEEKQDFESMANAFKAKALDETSKRQALEERLRVAEQARPEVEAPDAFTAPDEAIQHSNNELRQEFTGKLLDMSEEAARIRHSDDFDTMKDVFFGEMTASNPLLVQQAMSAKDPYEFVYQQAKTHKEFEGISSMDDLKSKLEIDIRAKLEAEYADKASKQANDAINGALPQTLSNATAVGGNKAPQWAGPTSLNSILGGK